MWRRSWKRNFLRPACSNAGSMYRGPILPGQIGVPASDGLKENAAKRIKKVPRQQDETLFFTREQYDALIEATYYYDRRGEGNGGQTTNSLGVRAYLKLLRWSGEADQGAEGGRARAISSNPPATSAKPAKIS